MNEITEIYIEAQNYNLQVGVTNKEVVEKFKTIQKLIGEDFKAEYRKGGNLFIKSKNKKYQFVFAANVIGYLFDIRKEVKN